MIKLDSISKSFPPSVNQVLREISFEFEAGKIYGLIGPSAVGKSVLLKLIAGIIKPSAGSLHYQEGASVSLMFQEAALFDSLSVLENVCFPLQKGFFPIDSLSAEKQKDIISQSLVILEKVGLANAINKLPGQLSGGMRRRAALARALVSKDPIVLLDDPTSGLDPVSSAVIMDLIYSMHQEYKPLMIVVSHDLRRLFPVTENILALFDSELKFTGNLQRLKNDAPRYVQEFVNCRFNLNE